MAAQRDQNLQREEQRKEAYARLTAPIHQKQSYFLEHEKIEGYQQDKEQENYFGYDRLLKMDSLYGTIQLGYDPKRGESFLFAHVKTSIFDSAPSREQRGMQDQRRVKEQKTGNQNQAYLSKRREDSAVLLYKAENKPWSEASIAPYLSRVNTGALRKTLPFLHSARWIQQGERMRRQDRLLQEQERELFAQHKDEELRQVRDRRVDLASQIQETSSLVWRSQQQSRWFFRRINLVFDLQKAKMFEYYRNQMRERQQEAENVALPQQEDEET